MKGASSTADGVARVWNARRPLNGPALLIQRTMHEENPMRRILLVALLLIPSTASAADKTSHDAFVEQLRALDTNIASPDAKLSNLVPNDIRHRLREANAQSTADWQRIDSREAW